MRLHLHEWGKAAAPPLVCIHGVSAHGGRFARLAEERLAQRFRVLAPDLRGHGRSGWEPPWLLETHQCDVLETLDAAGVDRAHWLGHSYGGRLLLELAASAGERLLSAVLLDPAIAIPPPIGLEYAERARVEKSFSTVDEAVQARLENEPDTPLEFLEEDARTHLAAGPDGRLRFRFVRSAVVSMYGELCTPPPPPETLQVPTLLLYASEVGLVRPEQVAAYRAVLGERLRVVPVGGGHTVYWGAYQATADAVEAFLQNPGA